MPWAPCHPTCWTIWNRCRTLFACNLNRKLLLNHVAAILTVAGLAACQHGLRSIALAGLAPLPRSTVAEWVSRYAPRNPVRYELRWRFQNDRGAAGGRAAVRIVPPDSLRLDFPGP